MKFQAGTKLFLGLLSVLLVGYLLWTIAQALPISTDQKAFLSVDDIMGQPSIDPWLVAIVAVSYTLAFLYAVLLRRTSISQELRPLWVVALFGIPVVALPVFWFSYVWRGSNVDQATVSGD